MGEGGAQVPGGALPVEQQVDAVFTQPQTIGEGEVAVMNGMPAPDGSALSEQPADGVSHDQAMQELSEEWNKHLPDSVDPDLARTVDEAAPADIPEPPKIGFSRLLQQGEVSNQNLIDRGLKNSDGTWTEAGQELLDNAASRARDLIDSSASAPSASGVHPPSHAELADQATGELQPPSAVTSPSITTSETVREALAAETGADATDPSQLRKEFPQDSASDSRPPDVPHPLSEVDAVESRHHMDQLKALLAAERATQGDTPGVTGSDVVMDVLASGQPPAISPEDMMRAVYDTTSSGEILSPDAGPESGVQPAAPDAGPEVPPPAPEGPQPPQPPQGEQQ